MFIGHYAVGFAAKKAAPRVSLGVLLAAPQLLDMLWPVFLLLGIERVRIEPGNTPFTPLAFDSYPWSHSLLMAVVWGGLFALLVLAFSKNGAGALVVFALVTSHWVLDWVTHGPDMPLSPWSETKVGIGLWNSVPGTLAVEGALYAAGLTLYLRSTRARDAAGRWILAALVLFLLVMYLFAAFGQPPPNVTVLAWGSLALWLVPAWGWWIDRHREPA
jgi:membrane-bound metal-dependent hydrolase YbcI (DUF457 family)